MSSALTMQEWVETDFYEGLIKMPLWTVSAFGNLKPGDTIYKDDVRMRLIDYLVLQSMDKCPPALYNSDYRHLWDTRDFIRIIKAVISAYRIKNYHKEPEVIYDKDAGIDKTDEMIK